MAPAWLLLCAATALLAGHAAGLAQVNCAGYECPDYDIIDVVQGDVEIRRYRQGQWVKYPVPGDDFTFMAEYGDERLSGFFLGLNYDHQVFNRSTPLTVEFNVWDHTVQRYSGYWIPLEEEDLPPAPVPPAKIDKVGETFLFAKKYNDTMDFRTVCRNIAMGMVDLAVDGEPFIMDTVSIAMYSYPKEGGGERQQDEIWFTRSFKHWDSPDVPVLQDIAANISRAFSTV
eukprot:evm.model.scf_2149.2 EVM.evm.TU.scf_2149.2   scf_2149:13546-16881(-)